MRSMMRNMWVGLVLIYSPPVCPQLIGSIEGGRVTDVGPEAAGTYGICSEAFLIRGRDEVVATSAAGLYKTTDGGKTWARSMSGLVDPVTGVDVNVSGLCQSPSSPEIGYALTTQHGIARTTDFEVWSLPGVDFPPLRDCAVDPVDPAVVYALATRFDPVRSGLLFKSVDGGMTFAPVGVGLPQSVFTYAVVVASTNRDRIYVAVQAMGARLFASADGGLTFEALPNAPRGTWRIYPHPTEDGTLLVREDAGGLFLSTDAGASFARVGAGLPAGVGRDTAMIAFDSADPTIVYAAEETSGFYRSEDGAQTFVRLDGLSERDLVGIGVSRIGVTLPSAEKGPTIYVGTSLGPYRSDERGDSFKPIHAGYRGAGVRDLAIDAAGRLLVANADSGVIFRSTADGAYEIIGDNLAFPFVYQLEAVAAAPDDPDLYLAVSSDAFVDAHIFRTTDGGHSWSQSTIFGRPVGAYLHPVFAPSDATRVYGVMVGVFVRCVDGGQTFESRPFPYWSGPPFVNHRVAVDPTNPDVIYASGGEGLFKSTNGGDTFQQVSPGEFIAIAINSKHPQTIYAASRATNEIVRSLDGGETFSSMTVGGDRALGLGIDSLRPERVFAWMHAGGLFRSEDDGESWIAVDADETLRRSNAESGFAALVVAPVTPARVYLGHASVLQFLDDF